MKLGHKKGHRNKIHAGIDIEEVSRIERLYTDLGEDFLKYIYSHKELKMCGRDKVTSSYLTRNFSMKESISKLLGKGFLGIKWTDISMECYEEKSEAIKLYENGLDRFRDIGGGKIHYSFSFCDDEVITIAISE